MEERAFHNRNCASLVLRGRKSRGELRRARRNAFWIANLNVEVRWLRIVEAG